MHYSASSESLQEKSSRSILSLGFDMYAKSFDKLGELATMALCSTVHYTRDKRARLSGARAHYRNS